MNVKDFFKPTIFKILIFLFISVFYLYFAGEDACGAGFGFSFCYKAHGYPFLYLVTGNIDIASGYLKDAFLGKFFAKPGNFLFNPLGLALDIIFIYILACLVSIPLEKLKLKHQYQK